MSHHPPCFLFHTYVHLILLALSALSRSGVTIFFTHDIFLLIMSKISNHKVAIVIPNIHNSDGLITIL